MSSFLDLNKTLKRYRLIGDKIREKTADFFLDLPFNIHPNTITLLSFIFGIFSALSFSFSYYFLAALLYYFSDVLDGADGVLARKKGVATPYGAYLDSTLDRYVDALIILGICLSLSKEYSNAVFIIGVLAIIGNFLISYTVHRAEALGKVILSSFLPWYRRIRMHLIVLGALFNQLFFVLIVLVFVGNLKILLRLRPGVLKNFPQKSKKNFSRR